MTHKTSKVCLAEQRGKLFDRTFHKLSSHYVELVNAIIYSCPYRSVSVNIRHGYIGCISCKSQGIALLYSSLLVKNELVCFLSCHEPYIVAHIAHHLYTLLLENLRYIGAERLLTYSHVGIKTYHRHSLVKHNPHSAELVLNNIST